MGLKVSLINYVFAVEHQYVDLYSRTEIINRYLLFCLTSAANPPAAIDQCAVPAAAVDQYLLPRQAAACGGCRRTGQTNGQTDGHTTVT